MRKKSKNLINHKNKEKIIRLPISKFIDSKFRDYAVYVLEQRGIPNFYDALTPVQRFILKNSPVSFQKTLSVVGNSISDGYHHGNSSIENSISRLARPFSTAMQILEGDGFFGTEISPTPAAARYTAVRLSPVANGILNKYNYLTSRLPDGPYDPLWMDIPLGLVNPIVGIAVGYKATILPRKLKDIQDFLEEKRKSVKPYFEGFSGKIQKYEGNEKTWIISSNVEVEGKKIMVREIPPIIKYESILKKLDYLINKYESNIRIINNSNIKVNMDIVYIGKNSDEFKDIINFVEKIFSIIVSESVVFIKDGKVLVYDSIEQYLEDYKWQIVRLKLKNTEYEKNKLFFDLEFNIAKEKFIAFILTKKRTNDEINIWLRPYSTQIIERLERMTSRKFTIDELNSTKLLIKSLEKELKSKQIELKQIQTIFNNYPDPTLVRGIGNKTYKINLFETEDITESKDGITIWDGSDVFDGTNFSEVDE